LGDKHHCGLIFKDPDHTLKLAIRGSSFLLSIASSASIENIDNEFTFSTVFVFNDSMVVAAEVSLLQKWNLTD
jgi:hypothetical protein